MWPVLRGTNRYAVVHVGMGSSAIRGHSCWTQRASSNSHADRHPCHTWRSLIAMSRCHRWMNSFSTSRTGLPEQNISGQLLYNKIRLDLYKTNSE